VTKLTLRYSESLATTKSTSICQRSDQTGEYETMATVRQFWDGYDTERSTTAISNATIDNEWHHYWLNLDLPIDDPSYSMDARAAKISSIRLPSRSASVHITLHIRRRVHPFLRKAYMLTTMPAT